jgi:eukaryotic-like serine/threonine-protein kinase
VACLTEDTVLALIAGTAAEPDATAAHAHLDDCGPCRRLMLLVAGGTSPRDQLAWLPTAIDGGAVPEAPRAAHGARFGRYVIQHLLGAGGAGVVYAAEDPVLARRVALKLLRTGDPDRLVREGRAIARLAHPHVVNVFDVGSHHGTVFVAMELVDGASLDVWIREAPRRWPEVVDVFVQAGQGLVAAHAAGMVHRDFKPANVLVGRDGRARVGDFGLATLEGAPGTSRTVAGTPAYMAPEQLDGDHLDARADQFGFGVALYECLYGARPFAGTTVAELRASIARGELPPQRTTDPVPAWLRRIVLRMLRPCPDDRYAGLADALAEIRRVPARRRRRIAIAAGAVTVALTATLAAIVARGSPAPVCQGGGALAATWDGARATAVIGALARLGLPTGPAVASRLDAYAEAWTTMARDACEAARVHGTQSAAQHERRTLCLDERRRELGVVVELIVHGDRALASNAPLMVAALPAIAACANLGAVTGRVPLPADLAIRARLAAQYARLAELRARGAAGAHREAYAGAAQLAIEAGATGYRPLEAEVLLAAGVLARAAGDPVAAEGLLARAAQAAIAGHDDVTAAAAWTAQVRVLAHLARYEAGQAAAGHAAAAIERLGEEPLARSELDFHRAQLLYAQSQLDPARAAIERALDRRRDQVAPETDPTRADMLVLRGLIDEARGEPTRARDAYGEALAIDERVLGPDHVKCAGPLRVLGSVERGLGNLDRAERALRRSLALTERAGASQHPDHAVTLNYLGQLLTRQGRHAEALVAYRRALALHEHQLGADHPTVAFDLAGVGNALVALGQLDDAAAAYARGHAITERARGGRHPDIAAFLLGQASVAEARGAWRVAEDRLRHAIELRAAALGPGHPLIASSLATLGRVLVAARLPARATAAYETVVAQDAFRTHPIARAAYHEAQLELGKLLWRRHPARAQQLVASARDGLEDPDLRGAAVRWLAERP